jgi:acyl-CoA synthetase (AMP-forming)/AMP-acid ligase II
VSEFLRLSRVAAASRPPELAVAVRGGRPLPWSTLVADVGRLATVLEARGGGAWLLFAEDCYAFTVGLLAIWQAGGTAVVPPNDQPGTVASLGEGLQGLVSDRSLAVPGLPSLDPLAAGDVDPWGWRPLAEDVPRLLLCTSGTTGARKAIPKTLAHLGDEVEGLEGRWGARLAGRPVFATVSHHHISLMSSCRACGRPAAPRW